MPASKAGTVTGAARTRTRVAPATPAANPTPSQKAHHTATWARTMAKWLITHSAKGGVKWQVVQFNGAGKQESRGIVDMIAIRKKHGASELNQHRGDLFEIVLIQVKGGAAKFPSQADVERLLAVKEHHRADKVVLVEWKKSAALRCFLLPDMDRPVPAAEIFGVVPAVPRALAAKAART
jgi:hypothetical protein